MDSIWGMLASKIGGFPLASLMGYGKPKVELNDQYYQNNFNTPLNAKEEAEFQKWAKEVGRSNDTMDYDLRGFWKSGSAFAENGHGSDKYKKPNHPTFSDQSVYHGVMNPNGGKFMGGVWAEGRDGSYSFAPSTEMLTQPGYKEWMVKEYFPKYEKGNTFLVK